MNVTLRQLRAFRAVARTGSFTLAAESLYITQSALSGLIKELESTLDVRLVDRSTRRVNLTEAGERLHPMLDGVLNDLDDMLKRTVDPQAMQAGVVRVATSQLLASTLMPGLIASFQRDHPSTRIALIDVPVEDVMARVFSGEAELGIGPEREPNSDITSTRLFDGPFMALFPPGHALARVARLRWNHLASHPVVVLRGQFIERLRRDLHDVDPRVTLAHATEVGSMATVLSMVEAGLGVGLCIAYAGRLVELHGLEMKQLGAPTVRRTFEVLTRRGRSLSPVARAFLDDIGPKIRAMPHLR